MQVLEHPVTPSEISSSLRELIDELVPGGQPVYVDVVPLENVSANDCFMHVPERVLTHGGSAVLGWSLYELPGVFVEAEAHAVWLRPSGDYLDITPKNSETGRVYFLPDSALRYEGRQINNVRKPVVHDPFIQAYLDTFTDEFKAIQIRRAEAFLGVLPRLPKLGPYLPCPCGSGNKMKWCHKTWE